MTKREPRSGIESASKTHALTMNLPAIEKRHTRVAESEALGDLKTLPPNWSGYSASPNYREIFHAEGVDFNGAE
jgi:hypothetical protein